MLAAFLAGPVVMAMLAAPLMGQARETGMGHIGLIQDWSHRHILFPAGASPAVAAAQQRDPRSWQSLVQRSAGQFRNRASDRLDLARPGFAPFRPAAPAASQRDWAISLGPNGGMPVGETPAKFTFNVNAVPDCANDFVVFVINATPAAGTQANIVAFNNLYTGAVSSSCPNGPQTPPTTDFTTATFMWSYAVGNGRVRTSPVTSLDGKLVAFVAASTPNPTFNVLTWVAGQGTNATTGAVAPGAGGSSVVALDFTNTTVAGCAASPAADSSSSPYIDYDHDIAYVGDENGRLYRIRGVFHSAPVLDYCISVSPGNRMTSPVQDPVSGNVFISDGQSVFSLAPGATSFTLNASIQVAGTAASIVQSPLVDSTNGFVYVFSRNDLTNTNAIVSQMPLSLATHVDARIGPPTTRIINDGAVDDKFFTLGPAGGSLYACGTQANNANKPSLYTLVFLATGVLNPVPAMADNRRLNGGLNSAGNCSPLTEFFDGTTDRLFIGAGRAGFVSGSNRMNMYRITDRLVNPTRAPNAVATNELGGTSAITIDNLSAIPQASSIYFGTLSKGAAAPCGAGLFCAVKLTQSALQ
jgi:hypothetical protein